MTEDIAFAFDFQPSGDHKTLLVQVCGAKSYPVIGFAMTKEQVRALLKSLHRQYEGMTW